MQEQIRERVARALPSEFNFYHLGPVRPEIPDPSGSRSDAPSLLDSTLYQSFAYSLYGEFRGVAVALFDSELDASLCKELGNTLASRLADSMSTTDQLVMISPPIRLSPTQYGVLRRGSEPVCRTYLLAQNRITLVIFPLTGEWTNA